MSFAARDIYALELRGLGIVWTTGTISLPGLSPEYRPGLTGVGGQLRASISLLDASAKSSGMGFTLAGDTALELMRAGGDPVESGGVPVRFLARMDSFISASTTRLWFSGELDVDAEYTIGGEVIRIVSLQESDGARRQYSVVRGAGGSRAAAWPVYWDPPEDESRTADLYLSRMPERIRVGESDYGVLALVYPAGRPETLAGWPIRLWRSTDGGTAQVVYEGSVSRIGSQGASITVQTSPQAEADTKRRWRVAAGGWLLISAIGAVGLTRATAAAIEEMEPIESGLSRESAHLVSRGARLFGTSAPIWGVPRCSLSDPTRIGGVLVRLQNESWVVMAIAAVLDTPFDAIPGGQPGSAGQVVTVDDDRYWFFRLHPLFIDLREVSSAYPRIGVVAYGKGELLTDLLQPPDSIIVSGRQARVFAPDFGLLRAQVRWIDETGATFEDAGEPETLAVAEMIVLPNDEIEAWPADLRGPAPIPQAVYRAFGWEDRLATVFSGVGLEGTRSGDVIPPPADNRLCIRSPHTGRDFGEVIEAQVGARPQAVSVSPGGEMVLVSWLLPEDGSELVVDEDVLPDTIGVELGERAGVARIVLERDDLPDLGLSSEGGSLSPRGVEIERDVSAVATARDVSSLASAWASILSRYRRSVPVATFAARDDGSGLVQALAPGVPIILRDPVAPNASGTRDLAARGVVMEVAVDTLARVARVTALLVDYGVDAVAPWGPALLFTGAGTGTALTLAAREMALDGSLSRFAQILAAAGAPVECVLYWDSGEEESAVTLTAVDEGAGTVSIASASPVTVAAGDFLVLRDAPAQVGTGRPTAYYGESRWAL